MFCPLHAQIVGEGEDLQVGTTYVVDLNSLCHSIIKLPINLGRLRFVEGGSVAKVMNRQSTGKQQDSLRSSTTTELINCAVTAFQGYTHLNSSKA